MEPGGGPRLVAATQERKTPVTPAAGNPGVTADAPTPVQAGERGTTRSLKRILSDSLDEEDPAVPADTVGPVFR